MNPPTEQLAAVQLRAIMFWANRSIGLGFFHIPLYSAIPNPATLPRLVFSVIGIFFGSLPIPACPKTLSLVHFPSFDTSLLHATLESLALSFCETNHLHQEIPDEHHLAHYQTPGDFPHEMARQPLLASVR